MRNKGVEHGKALGTYSLLLPVSYLGFRPVAGHCVNLEFGCDIRGSVDLPLPQIRIH